MSMKQIGLTKFKKSPSFSFRGKFLSYSNLKDSQRNPSPNLYNPQKPMKNPVKIVFSKSSRKTYFDRNPDYSPGPGQYESNKLTQRSTISAKSDSKFQTCSSRFYNRTQVKPGPGAYQIKNDFKKTLPAFSIRKKTKTFHQIEIQRNSFKQDPGAYDIEPKLFKDSSVISIPKSSRTKKQQNDSPGPGRYQVNQKLFHSQRSFGNRSFSSQIRKIDFKHKNQSPGPIYNFQSSFQSNKRKQRGFSCRIKFTNQNQESKETPGPGQYQSQPNLKFRSVQSFKIPQADRKTMPNLLSEVQKLPQPGRYGDLTKSYQKIKFNSQSAPKFSKAKLESLSSLIKRGSTDNFYDPKIQMIKKSSSSFSIGSSRRKQHFVSKTKENPGPGEYNPEDKLSRQNILSSKFPQSKRHNLILNKLKIGPGQYFNPNTSNSFSKTGIKFSKEQRKTDFNNLQLQNKSALRLMNIISGNVPGLKTVRR